MSCFTGREAKPRERWYLPKMTKMRQGGDLNLELQALLLRAPNRSLQLVVLVCGVCQLEDEKAHRGGK